VFSSDIVFKSIFALDLLLPAVVQLLVTGR